MRQDFGIECIDYSGRFRVTCRLPGAGLGLSYGELTVQDKDTGVHLTLTRPEWRPLLKSILQFVRGADGIVAGLPIDPVTRAVWQVPVKSYAAAMARGSIITAYHEELKGLQAKYVERAEALSARIRALAKD